MNKLGRLRQPRLSPDAQELARRTTDRCGELVSFCPAKAHLGITMSRHLVFGLFSPHMEPIREDKPMTQLTFYNLGNADCLSN